MDKKKVSHFATQYIHAYSEGIDEVEHMTDEEHMCGLIIAAYRLGMMCDINPYSVMEAAMQWKEED